MVEIKEVSYKTYRSFSDVVGKFQQIGLAHPASVVLHEMGRESGRGTWNFFFTSPTARCVYKFKEIC